MFSAFCQDIRQYIFSEGKKYCLSSNYEEIWILELCLPNHCSEPHKHTELMGPGKHLGNHSSEFSKTLHLETQGNFYTGTGIKKSNHYHNSVFSARNICLNVLGHQLASSREQGDKSPVGVFDVRNKFYSHHSQTNIFSGENIYQES